MPLPDAKRPGLRPAVVSVLLFNRASASVSSTTVIRISDIILINQ
jgi:hypothetical protein